MLHYLYEIIVPQSPKCHEIYRPKSIPNAREAGFFRWVKFQE